MLLCVFREHSEQYQQHSQHNRGRRRKSVPGLGSGAVAQQAGPKPVLGCHDSDLDAKMGRCDYEGNFEGLACRGRT